MSEVIDRFAWAGVREAVTVKRRSDGRPHDTGTKYPRRPCPRDFRDRFIEMGWYGIEDYYHANWRCIRRWIEECGREELRAARAAYVREHGPRPGVSSARRYVLGRTLQRRKG